jgi:hypothetical protein
LFKVGTPAVDDTSFKTNLWNGLPILRFGGVNEPDGNGVAVKVPDGMSVLWLRVLSDRWASAKFTDITTPTSPVDLGRYVSGFRSLSKISPDGGVNDTFFNVHTWMPVPLPPGKGARTILVTSKPNTNGDYWVSGLAFSTNPWNHATNSAAAYNWASNGGQATGWSTPNWNNDQQGLLTQGTKVTINVPIVPSGKDKLLYIVESNPPNDNSSVTNITVGTTPIERFKSTYDNPFARHFNGKIYNRYIAAKVPKELVGATATFLTVTIDMGKQNTGLLFREIGTHDMYVF